MRTHNHREVNITVWGMRGGVLGEEWEGMGEMGRDNIRRNTLCR